MVKDIKYIIKRILIGVGICLVLSLIRSNLFLMVNAQSYNYIPNDIIIAADYNVRYSTTTYTWWNNTYYGFPNNTPTDWNPSNTNIYFRYPQFSGSILCASTSNNGSISGVIANGSRNIDVVPIVRFEDVTNNMYYSCQSSFDGQLLSFNCNNINLSHPLNIVLSNATPGIWGIKRQLEINCSMTNEGLANSITQNQNQNTQSIINNQNQNNQSIINNQNQNTQDIIDNQNQNSEDTQNVIKEQFENCIDEQVVHPEFANVILYNGSGYQGVALNNNNSGGVLDISKYVGETITISFSNLDSSHSSRTNYCFIDSAATSTRKSCISYRISSTTSTSNTFTVTVPNKAKYLYLVGYNNYIDTTWVNNVSISLPKVCSNRLNDINNSLNDDSGVNDSDIDNLFGDIRGNSSSPVSDLLTLPITLLQAYLDGMSGSCSPYTLGTLYGTTLVLPCIDIPGIIGTSLWNVIDALFCLYMIYNIAMMCISIYESFTSLDDSMQLLYSPQHSGHTRVSRNEGEY